MFPRRWFLSLGQFLFIRLMYDQVKCSFFLSVQVKLANMKNGVKLYLYQCVHTIVALKWEVCHYQLDWWVWLYENGCLAARAATLCHSPWGNQQAAVVVLSTLSTIIRPPCLIYYRLSGKNKLRVTVNFLVGRDKSQHATKITKGQKSWILTSEPSSRRDAFICFGRFRL